MADLLVPVPSDVALDAWVAVLENRLRDELKHAARGHCVRISDLPRPILERLADRLTQHPIAGTEVYFVDRLAGPESWRVAVHKVVERRNAEECALIALFPPNVQLAAGDSVDVSTFRVIPTANLPIEVENNLIERIPPTLRAKATEVLKDLKQRGWPVTTTARITYLATVEYQNRQDDWVVGAALFALGLIPDFELLKVPSELHYRLGQNNLPIVKQMQPATATPLERLLRLPIADASFRERLIAFFDGRVIENVSEWGEAIACDAQWRDLALECWPLRKDSHPGPGLLRIDVEPLNLPKRDDGVLYLNPAGKVKVAWQTDPAPMNVPDLAYFRIELLSADRVISWESPLIKNTAGKTAKRSRTVKGLEGLDAGIHFFRVIALNSNGEPFPDQPLRDPDSDPDGKHINETEDVLLLQSGDEDSAIIEEFAPLKHVTVRSFAQAETLARIDSLKASKDPDTVRSHQVEWSTPSTAYAESAYANIRFDVRRQYTVHLSQRLRKLESRILERPQEGGHYKLTIGSRPTEPEPQDLALPPSFALARQGIFTAIRQQIASDDSEPAVALVDLCSIAAQVDTYAHAYYKWLMSGDSKALLLDVIRAEMPEFGNGANAALVAPTHPLRLLWALQEQQMGRAWTKSAWEQNAPDFSFAQLLQNGLPSQGIPSLLVLGAEEGYMDVGPLPGGWEAYLPPRLHDSRAAVSLLRSRTGGGGGYHSDADVPPKALADKFELFLRQHPYNQALVVNVVNPGDARLVVDALILLEQERHGQKIPSIRYAVRIFSEFPTREGIGDAFAELVDPDRQISESAALLLGSSESFLFPKLSWSHNDLKDFIERPETYPAHITLLLDAFPVALRVARREPADRSSFVYGLVQDAPRRFVGKGRAYTWVRRPSPTACVDLPAAGGRSALLANLLSVIYSLQATVLAPVADTRDSVAVAALELTLANQSLLYSAHAASTWVLTIDPHLGVDYFDAPRLGDQPGYLLDFTPEFAPSGGRQLLLTTRIDDEIAGLMEPAASQLDVQGNLRDVGPHMLLETLRSLSGRLALKVLSHPTQVQGALGMALSRLFLESYKLLEDAIIVPLDAHPELVTAGTPAGEPQLRSDLMIVSAEPNTRHLRILLVEAKCYSGTGLDEALRQHITEQLKASELGIRKRFDPQMHEPDRLDRAVQSWQLSTVLVFYLDRAVRYGLVDQSTAASMRQFFLNVDVGYTLSTQNIGLVFRSGADDTYEDIEDPDVHIWVIGREVTSKIVDAALERFNARTLQGVDDGTGPQTDDHGGRLGADLEHDITWSKVRTTFGKGSSAPSPAPTKMPASHEQIATASSAQNPLPEPVRSPISGADTRMNENTPSTKHENAFPSVAPVSDALTPVPYEVLLGEAQPTPQYGILGTVATDPTKRVALDLNGCNTISVFGVQGSGKSYTVGSVVEMSTMRIPGLNVLPDPLGAVVFHFSQTQDYPPEFVAMAEPNDDRTQLQALARYGVSPQGLKDTLLLTTNDTLESRRREFPDVDVQPIAFASTELSVADWRFLMGATGNDALYIKLLNEVMRQARTNLSLDAIKAGLAQSPMSDAQRLLAHTRLDFASRFVDDSRSLRSLLRPGRLIVVDLRDEFVEKEQALGLFVTMLNVFSGAGLTGDRFNKLIVFDEAHKYMDGSLSKQVTEVIREMRHRGVSVVIASQDPINVPAAVIELSSTVILHRFNSPNWIRHIQRSLAALGELTPQMFASLGPGEAFAWSNKSTDISFTRRPVKVRMRPRVSKHGGSTRMAVSTRELHQ